MGPDPGVLGELRQDRFLGPTDLTHWYTPWGRVLARAARELSARIGPYATLLVTILVGAGIAGALSIIAAQVYDSVTDDEESRALIDRCSISHSPYATRQRTRSSRASPTSPAR